MKYRILNQDEVLQSGDEYILPEYLANNSNPIWEKFRSLGRTVSRYSFSTGRLAKEMRSWKVVIEDNALAVDIGDGEILRFDRLPGRLVLLDKLCDVHNRDVERMEEVIKDTIKIFERVVELAKSL